MSSHCLYLSPTAHSSPGMKQFKMNNKTIFCLQSVSITSESMLSLSDLEDSIVGMASIVLTDSDGEPETFSDAEDHKWHANTGYGTSPSFSMKTSYHPAISTVSALYAQNLQILPAN
ncbi:hypothetical protein ARMGADRAFT_1089498 [Armillaria gallica]|uniref:Uncharacterized protein n=1 Tax=Armillaria gallica TaxID=47427 RepID=A0A2H3D2Y3_ARMGA|nr:hypothetical protein ARMGADRAFT_1089498 [Armillaria gallica]